MAYETKIHRYVVTSLQKLLDPISGTAFAFWVEGINFDESEIFTQDNLVLRVIGPEFVPGGGEDVYRFDIFVMGTCLLDLEKNRFAFSEKMGAVAAALVPAIPINRWGDGDALIECLEPDRKANQFLRVVDFAVIEKDTRVKQTAVITKHELTIKH